MKAQLTFDLDDPDDRIAHFRCIKSLDMAIALFEIQNNLMQKIEDMVDNKIYDAVQSILSDAIGNLNINELIE